MLRYYKMGNTISIFLMALFGLASMCYLLTLIGKPLEQYGVKLGNLLQVPEPVIASTFAALATSGPEIVMAIQSILFSEDSKACSGLLNMSFSAMDNLIGIGCLGMIYLVWKGGVDYNEIVEVSRSTQISLLFYVISSSCLSLFITFDFEISVIQSWILMIIGILFIIFQFIVAKESDKNSNNDTFRNIFSITFFKTILLYSFCIYGLWIVVRECLDATFLMASAGIVSIAGVLIMFTSYISSFPEFAMAYQFAKSNKKDSMLAMLFGSNVVDLAFAGFRCIWTGKSMKIIASSLLPIYIWLLPVTSISIYLSVRANKMKYKHAYFLMGGYVVYIFSGFVLL